MSKFIVVGNTIMNVDRIGAVWIEDNIAVTRRPIGGLNGAYSVLFEIDCGAHTHTTYMTGYPTREAANKFIKEVFDALKDVTKEKDEKAETSGKPEPVLFEKYKDQWVKAKLTYHTSRLRALTDGEVYRIQPYMSMVGKRFQCRSEHFKGLRSYSWDDVQFVLVEEGGEQ